MSVQKFFHLKVKDVRSETSECISVSFEIPDSLKKTFSFIPGQYITLQLNIDGSNIRRSYSICSGINEPEMRIAIKKVENGKFSNYTHSNLKAGDIIDVMPPMGNFVSKTAFKSKKNYLAFAAGSGITPIISILKSILETEPDSNFVLVYGNKGKNSIIFFEELEALKNKYMHRLSLYYVLSRELMDVPLLNGRIDDEKCREFCRKLIDLKNTDEVFICGPEKMLFEVKDTISKLGMPNSNIRIELFTSPEQPKTVHQLWVEAHKTDNVITSKVSIKLDGNTFTMDVPYNGESILDAALKHGADLPYACKGGVCCTCRAKLAEGKVEMEVNYSLPIEEIEKGFILTCQSHPLTERVVIDFDER